jgi:hypothetical protein
VILPDGADPQNELYLLASDSAEGVTQIDDPRVVPLIDAQIRSLFPRLERKGGADRFSTGLGPGLALTWEGKAPTGEAVRARAFLTLPGDGKVIYLLGLAEKSRFESREKAIRTLFASLAQDKQRSAGKRSTAAGKGDADNTLSRQWRQRLSGQKLTYLTSYNSGSAGGYSAKTVIHLIPDGRCSFYSNSQVSVDVGGAAGGSSGQNEFDGKWRVLANGSTVVLELVPNGKAESLRFALTNQDGKTFLNGRRFFVTDP